MATTCSVNEQINALWAKVASMEASTSLYFSVAGGAVVLFLVARWIRRSAEYIMDRICNRTYIYNCCWEDPAVDHDILKIQPSDIIFRICSAGDIVLDYAIEGPSKIVVCDMNQHQYVPVVLLLLP